MLGVILFLITTFVCLFITICISCYLVDHLSGRKDTDEMRRSKE